MEKQRPQAATRLLMIRPVNFSKNLQTSENNFFQTDNSTVNVQDEALQEFDDYVALLEYNGIQVITIQDKSTPHTPDSIFPNNWFSTHITGELIYYPMFANNRRMERTTEIKGFLEILPNINRVIDLSSYELQETYLEGTGSMVLDRVNKIVYACKSARTTKTILDQFCSEMDYKLIFFDSYDRRGMPIYHTNVMMGIGRNFVVICLDSITDINQKNEVIESFKSTNHTIIPITLDQLDNFAGNIIEVKNRRGDRFILMSNRAFLSLEESQRTTIEKYATILHPKLDVIESHGGGSARCMVAEIFNY